MPTITAGQVGLETLERGRRLKLTVSGNGTAVAQRFYAGTLLESVALAASEIKTFGEFHVDVSFRLICQAGTLVYQKLQNTAPIGSGGSGTLIEGTEDVPGLDPVLEDLDTRVISLTAMLTGIDGGTPSSNFAGVASINGGTP